MKVIFSTDAIKYPLTGVGRYSYELAKGLQQSNFDDLLFLNGINLQSAIPDCEQAWRIGGHSKYTKLTNQMFKLVKENSLAGWLHGIVVPWNKGRVIKNYHDYVFHGPNFYLPKYAGVSIATIHDLSVYKYPQTHPDWRVRYMRKQIGKTLKRANFLITPTEYTRKEVGEYFNWPLERIYAVHHGFSVGLHPRTKKELFFTLTDLGLHAKHYVLYTGTIEPRKNLLSLLQAYELLPISLRLRYPLVLSGYSGWLSEDLHMKMGVAQRAGWLKYLGFVDTEVLPQLMAGARLFVYPSLYEGFGLPVLEAMASGVPVICSDASTLPEVAGGAAALHKPEDVDALRDWLLRGLEDDLWCAQQSEAGLARAAQFSWQRCVQETMNVYRQVAR